MSDAYALIDLQKDSGGVVSVLIEEKRSAGYTIFDPENGWLNTRTNRSYVCSMIRENVANSLV